MRPFLHPLVSLEKEQLVTSLFLWISELDYYIVANLFELYRPTDSVSSYALTMLCRRVRGCTRTCLDLVLKSQRHQGNYIKI